jgi:hypothetical protein
MLPRISYRIVSAANRGRWAAVVLTVLAGCGLGDYEERLKEEYQRAKGLDEEKKLLAEPLELPQLQVVDNPVLPENLHQGLNDTALFVRSPKVFGCRAMPVGVVGMGKTTGLYGYAGPDGFAMLLAGTGSTKESQSDFEWDVTQAFRTYLKNSRGLQDYQLPEDFKFKKVRKQPIALGKDIPQALEFDTAEWAEPEPPGGKKESKTPADKAVGEKEKKREPARYFLHFLKKDNMQVAVIYEVPASRANDAAVLKGIDASLKSVGVGADALERRKAYFRWK